MTLMLTITITKNTMIIITIIIDFYIKHDKDEVRYDEEKNKKKRELVKLFILVNN